MASRLYFHEYKNSMPYMSERITSNGARIWRIIQSGPEIKFQKFWARENFKKSSNIRTNSSIVLRIIWRNFVLRIIWRNFIEKLKNFWYRGNSETSLKKSYDEHSNKFVHCIENNLKKFCLRIIWRNFIENLRNSDTEEILKQA